MYLEKMWKMYRNSDGRASYQNEALELRDAYRVVVYIKNLMKERVKTEKESSHSLLYHLFMRWKNSNEAECNEIDSETFVDRFLIDNNAILVGWNLSDGVYIMPETQDGNRIIHEIAGCLKQENVWWNNEIG